MKGARSFLILARKFVRNEIVLLSLVMAVLAVSFGATYWVWQLASQDASDNLKAEFDFKAHETLRRIEQRILNYEYVLRGAHGFFLSSNHVSQDDFRTYVVSLDLEKYYPGIKGMGVSKAVPKERILQHIADIRKRGFPYYTVFPEGERPVYYPVFMREPFVGSNRLSLGYDLYSEPVRRSAMEKARDSGSIAVTSKLMLFQDDDGKSQVGFLMFFPLYKDMKGVVPSTIEERRAAIAGWVYAPVRISELMEGLGGERTSDLDIEVYDGDIESKKTMMYDSDNDPLSINADNVLLKATYRIEIGGHSWILAIHSLPAFESRLDSGKPGFIAVAGISLSLLLALLTFLLANGRRRALALATKMIGNLRDSEARYERVMEGSEEGFWDWNLKTGEFTVSPQFEFMLGYEAGERDLRQDNWSDYVHPDDLDQALQRLDQHLQGQIPVYEAETRRRTKSGKWKWVYSRGKIVAKSEDGSPLIIAGTHTDISERKKADEELQLASLVYQTSSEGMTITDASGTILSINPAFTELTGYTQDEVIGKTPRILQSGHHGKDFYESMWSALVTTGQWRGEIWNRRKSGEVYPEWLSISSTFNEDGSVHRRVTLFSDITKKKELEELLWQQANIDLLTGLPNRRMFLDRLEQEIRKSHRADSQMALLFLDLDHFKDVNDTLGHVMGDVLLKEASQRLVSCVRETDTVARLGGDEFTLILCGLQGADSVERVALEIMHKLAAPFQLGNELAYISASIGITLYPQDAVKPEDLLVNADQAMYAAKRQGRNRYHYFTSSMQQAAQTRMRLINDLRDSLGENQFRVYYQPIVELQTGATHKAEALIRWQHPVRGMISPADFIPLAEETGMIVEIGEWVFHTATEQAARWRDSLDPQFQVSVNISPVQFRNGGINLSVWFDYLRIVGLQTEGVVFEITEGMLMDASADVTDQLLEFRNAGIEVSLDDFGTGYSSMSYLKKFDIDYLKIDQSFVRNLSAGSDDMALCEAMIVMAHTLGIKVIAEGVETQEQCDLLAAAGCDYGQGYLFSKPVPPDELESFLWSGRTEKTGFDTILAGTSADAPD